MEDQLAQKSKSLCDQREPKQLLTARQSKSESSLSVFSTKFSYELLMESIVPLETRDFLRKVYEKECVGNTYDDIMRKSLLQKTCCIEYKDMLYRNIKWVQELTKQVLSCQRPIVEPDGFLMAMNVTSRLVLFSMLVYDEALLETSVNQFLRLKIIINSRKSPVDVPWMWASFPSDSLVSVLLEKAGRRMDPVDIDDELIAKFEKPSSLKRKSRVILPVSQDSSDGDDERLLKYMKTSGEGKRARKRLRSRTVVSDVHESTDEEVSGQSSLKYRRKAVVKRIACSRLYSGVLSADERGNPFTLVHRKSKAAMRNGTVVSRLSRQLFYTDGESSSDCSVDKSMFGGAKVNVGTSTSAGRGGILAANRGVKRSMADNGECREVKRLRENPISLPSTPAVQYKTNMSERSGEKMYNGYCLFSTIRQDDKLLVYLSKHTPKQHYKHFQLWLSPKPAKDNLYCVVYLSELCADEVKDVIDFFSPQNAWCRSTYCTTADTHCKCCPSFQDWCGKLAMDYTTLKLVYKSMVPGSVLEAGCTADVQ